MVYTAIQTVFFGTTSSTPVRGGENDSECSATNAASPVPTIAATNNNHHTTTVAVADEDYSYYYPNPCISPCGTFRAGAGAGDFEAPLERGAGDAIAKNLELYDKVQAWHKKHQHQHTQKKIKNQGDEQQKRRLRNDNCQLQCLPSASFEQFLNNGVSIEVADSNVEDVHNKNISNPLSPRSSYELENSVSELTMRSHPRHLYTVDKEILDKGRRMAYYAVGNHSSPNPVSPEGKDERNTEQGSRLSQSNKNSMLTNRRCYFTGRPVGQPSGMPFYAGTVQQGLRTLVIFYNHSHGTLDDTDDGICDNSDVLEEEEMFDGLSRSARNLLQEAMDQRNNNSRTMKASNDHTDEPPLLIRKELSESQREKLLHTLPPPNQKLLNQIERRYTQQFHQLPMDMQNADSWKLYSCFCFFSGLPIADGELHYRLKQRCFLSLPPAASGSCNYEHNLEDENDEVLLSHDVFETAAGKESAQILRLPNTKTFQYLKRHYAQQSCQLEEKVVFDRKNWEVVLPEF
eukprot:CAMPEP_0194361260 /NCGR_PEP_ID=MMETSP0174-20130528/8833_1 /TAXON_ID=216777 /ORGANISM="Proboscia alata, Strain PI-D3" /LENGTH=515 /DNA_ID=CAMNT_0039133371 /DNA_START=207 /DNA_END=1754 /DNA_ORIENTATION=+